MSNSLSGNDTVLFGPEPKPGDRLGNYILDRKLGSGGMGHVWKATHEPTGKPYAIKLLPPIIASNPDAWDQVRRNFDIIENLNHPHICAVKVLDRDPKFGPYLVMAHVEGMTLNKYRQGRTFTPEQVAAILKPVAEALDFAHSRKVIHRDIKHENIMVVLANDGQTIVDTYVIDFGLAAESRTVVTQFSQQSAPLAGTLRYMAPELWRGRPPVPASDQYALAVIAYELLAGYFPIDCPDRSMMRDAVLNEEAQSIALLTALQSSGLARGLHKDPNDRCQDCATFIAQLLATSLTQVVPVSDPVQGISQSQAKLPETVILEIDYGGDDSFGSYRDEMLAFVPTPGKKSEVYFDGKKLLSDVYLKNGINLKIDTHTGDHELLITWDTTMLNVMSGSRDRLPGEAKISFTLERKGRATLHLDSPAERCICFGGVHYS